MRPDYTITITTWGKTHTIEGRVRTGDDRPTPRENIIRRAIESVSP